MHTSGYMARTHINTTRAYEHENCHRGGDISVRWPNWPTNGIDVHVPPDTIFTSTILS